MVQEAETRIPGERAETVTARRIDSNPVLKRGAVALAVVAYSRGQKNASSRRETDDQAAPIDNNFVPMDNSTMSQDRSNGDQQKFDGLLRPTRLEGSRAVTLGNRDFVVAMGTSIPCVLETALASDQPGFTSCVVNRDVLSDNGRVVVMEKGTQVVGEYRGGLQRGKDNCLFCGTGRKHSKV